MAYRIFVSYVSKDSDLAEDLARRMREAGGRVFLDQVSARTEGRLPSKIARDLEISDEVVVLWTDHSVNSPWVLHQTGAAFGMHKRVTPVLVGSPQVPSFLRKIKTVRYTELPKYISGLRRRSGMNKQIKRNSPSSSKGVNNVRATASR